MLILPDVKRQHLCKKRYLKLLLFTHTLNFLKLCTAHNMNCNCIYKYLKCCFNKNRLLALKCHVIALTDLTAWYWQEQGALFRSIPIRAPIIRLLLIGSGSHLCLCWTDLTQPSRYVTRQKGTLCGPKQGWSQVVAWAGAERRLRRGYSSGGTGGGSQEQWCKEQGAAWQKGPPCPGPGVFPSPPQQRDMRFGVRAGDQRMGRRCPHGSKAVPQVSAF